MGKAEIQLHAITEEWQVRIHLQIIKDPKRGPNSKPVAHAEITYQDENTLKYMPDIILEIKALGQPQEFSWAITTKNELAKIYNGRPLL